MSAPAVTVPSSSGCRARARPHCRPTPTATSSATTSTSGTDAGIANYEAGCYAKLIDLDKQAEPVIAAALSMKGTLIENVPAA